MSKITFIIDYCVYFNDGFNEQHTIKVKNCMSEIHAKIKLEDFLKKKHSNFKNLIIYKCNNDYLGIFDNIFGKNNPFGI